MTYLIERGWTSVRKFFDHKAHTNIKPNKPKMNGEPCILIPIHIHNCHWIALSRKEINNKVIFIYCDDMNNQNDAADIKHIIQTKLMKTSAQKMPYGSNVKARTIFRTQTNADQEH
jgi:hypothetical protein